MGEKEKKWRQEQVYNTKFSIIIPMKNAEETIERAIESIKGQEYSNIELMI